MELNGHLPLQRFVWSSVLSTTTCRHNVVTLFCRRKIIEFTDNQVMNQLFCPILWSNILFFPKSPSSSFPSYHTQSRGQPCVLSAHHDGPLSATGAAIIPSDDRWRHRPSSHETLRFPQREIRRESTCVQALCYTHKINLRTSMMVHAWKLCYELSLLLRLTFFACDFRTALCYSSLSTSSCASTQLHLFRTGRHSRPSSPSVCCVSAYDARLEDPTKDYKVLWVYGTLC
jgi:hypothetical protein